MKDLTDKLMAYEQGDLSEAEEIELFQYLLDSGLCWTLQGHYGRQATRLMQAGLIRPKGE